MTAGIYKLSFSPEQRYTYIGKSTNIERRFVEHVCTLRRGEGTKKLQEAFSIFGIPKIHILVVSTDHLSELEKYYIKIYDSYHRGLNSTEGGEGVESSPSNPSCKYLIEDYYMVLWYLGKRPIYTFKQIEEETKVSSIVISKISQGISHSWLKQVFPKEYQDMESLRKIGRSSLLQKKDSIAMVQAPDGTIHTVDNISRFAKSYDLSQSKLSMLINGKVRQHKGWTIPGSIIKQYPHVISPSGVVYEIKVGEGKNFATLHNLEYTCLMGLLSGKQLSHKGWTIQKVNI